MNINLGDRLSNPRKQAVRKWLMEILQDRYLKQDPIVDRVASSLVTERDVDEFGKLVADIYEVGFMKCLNDYKNRLMELGLNVNVVAEHR